MDNKRAMRKMVRDSLDQCKTCGSEDLDISGTQQLGQTAWLIECRHCKRPEVKGKDNG